MARGDRSPPERRTLVDAVTGVEIVQLTNHKGHSHHLYFTNSGLYDGDRRLLFASDRENQTNLFSVELASGAITQLTELKQSASQPVTSLLFASVNPARDEAYLWSGRTLVALDLQTLVEKPLYEVADGFQVNMTSVTADGRFVCTGVYEDLSHRFPVDLLHGYVGFREYWEARPLSRILRVDTVTGRCDVVFEERYWIGHCNASPTRNHLLTFCHEGPWSAVDHRIWGLDIETGRSWKIRTTTPGEVVGHEYWLADGEHIAYHGRTVDGRALFGRVRHDDGARTEATFTNNSQHFHSDSLDLVIGDGSRSCPHLLLWRLHGRAFDGPRVLLTHRGSFQTQTLHVHPRMGRRGGQVLFTSDMSGYGNLYLADIPPFDSLPRLDDIADQ